MFALLGEVLLVGVLMTVGSLLVVTAPLALAAGIRHLRRFLKGDVSPVSRFWRDMLTGLPGGLAVGAAAAAAATVLLLNIRLASTGVLPGGAAIAPVSWAALAAVVLLAVAMAGIWTPESGWRRTFRSALDTLSADPVGALYVLAALVFAVIVTWQLLPLIIPGLGCVALAVVAAPERRRAAADG